MRTDPLKLLFRNQLEEYENDKPITSDLKYLFYNKTALKKILLPNKSGELGSRAFENCTSLEECVMPNITAIRDHAIRYNTVLSSINFPNVTRIGWNSASASESATIDQCSNLQVVYLPRCLTAYGGYNLNSNGKTGQYTTVVLPSLVTGDIHIFRSTKANAIDLGPNFHTIPSYSFYQGIYNNVILRRIDDIVTVAASNSIREITSTTKVYVPSALIDSYKAADYWSAKGDIFYPIEGSEYEHYYANGVHVSNIIFITKNATSSNTTPWVPYEDPYSTILSVDFGFEYQTFSITMGGVDITSSVYNAETGEVNIPHVTDAVLIKAIATPIEYDWDYEWDYTDGLLTDNGWTQSNWNTGGVATMTENGLELTSANNSNISFGHTDYLMTSGIMEVTLSATFGTGAYINANVCLSNGTNGVNFISPKGNGGIRNVSSVGSCTTFGALPSGTDFTVRLALNGTSGNVAINDIVKWRTDNIPGNSGTWAGSTRVMSESQQSGYSTIVKSIRIKRLDQGGES